MASYTNISFSSSAIEDQIKMAIEKALDDTVNEVKTWKYFEDAKVEDLGTFHKKITSQNLKAWIYYMGTGRYMNPKNPQLDEYIGGEYWNPARPSVVGADIVKRGNRSYTAPDWRSGKGTITTTGSNPAGAFVSKGEQAQEDFYWMLSEAAKHFQKRVQENLKKINVQSSIITTKENV